MFPPFFLTRNIFSLFIMSESSSKSSSFFRPWRVRLARASGSVRAAKPYETRLPVDFSAWNKPALPSAYTCLVQRRHSVALSLNVPACEVVLKYSFAQHDSTQAIDEAIDLASGVSQPALALRPVDIDDDVIAWCTSAINKPPPEWKYKLWRRLRNSLYVYDASVFVGIPRLFLLSTQQWWDVLKPCVDDAGGKARCLDVGAGRGDLITPVAPLFPGGVYATEVSAALVAWLTCARGIRALQTDAPDEALKRWKCAPFDAVLCLNVLDRCKDPAKLLRQCASVAHPTHGRVVVAIPLPVAMRDARKGQGGSQQVLDVRGSTFEEAAAQLVRKLPALAKTSDDDDDNDDPDAAPPVNLEVERLVRAPYLCTGPEREPIFVLDCAVVVLRRSGM